MIETKEELKDYLYTERILYLARNYGVDSCTRKRPRRHEKEWMYVISLRKMEYYKSILQKAKKNGPLELLRINPFSLCFHMLRRKRLSERYGIQIPLNVFGKGLLISHLHGIIVSAQAHVGKYCQLYHNVTLGISVGQDDNGKCPTIGNGVTFCAGAVAVGDIHLADEITVGANAVVTKSCDQAGCVLGGVPAKIISTKSWSMLRFKEKLGLS